MTLLNLKRLIKSAATDETRFHLCGVHLSKMNYGKSAIIRAQATDGHRAVTETLKNESLDLALNTGESILITRDHIKTLSTVYNSKGLQSMDLQFERKGSSLIVNALGIKLTITINEVNYPKIDQFFEVKRDNPFRISLDAALLASTIESMNSSGRKRAMMCVIEFDLSDQGKAFTIRCGDEPAKAVLMPMRGPSEDVEFNKSTMNMISQSKNA